PVPTLFPYTTLFRSVANLSDFGIPALLGSPARFETLATMVYRFMDSGTVDNPLQVVSTIGVVLLFLGIAAVFADHIVARFSASSFQDTGASARMELGPARVPVSIVSWLLALTITLAPIVG